MKRVIKTVFLIMMVSMLFGSSASAAGYTSMNAAKRLGTISSLCSVKKVSKGKSSQKSKKWKNKKSRKAAGSGVSKKAKRPNKSDKSIRKIAAESAAKSGSKSKTYEMEGKVIKQMPNAVFQVELKNGSTVIAHISGKLRMNFIRIRFGDRVLVEVFTDRPDKGRIIWRYKDSL